MSKLVFDLHGQRKYIFFFSSFLACNKPKEHILTPGLKIVCHCRVTVKTNQVKKQQSNGNFWNWDPKTIWRNLPSAFFSSKITPPYCILYIVQCTIQCTVQYIMRSQHVPKE